MNTEFSFRDLQLISEQEFTVEQTRVDLRRIVDFFKQQTEMYELGIGYLNQHRYLSMEILKECEVFFIDPDFDPIELPDEFRSYALGFYSWNGIRYSGRHVYPVKDVKGQVMGFVGWDPFEDIKYLDSKNHGYLAKNTTLYGMENLPTYYTNDKPVFFTEGSVCALWLRSQGFQALAFLGSRLKSYVQCIVRRFGNRAIIIRDNDDAGFKMQMRYQRRLPEARFLVCKRSKDIDELRIDIGEDKVIDDLKHISDPFMIPENLQWC